MVGRVQSGWRTNKLITEEHWTLERQESWDAAIGVLSDAIKLAYQK